MDSQDPADKVAAFGEDVISHGGYLYSTNASLSSRMANRRITDGIFGIVDFAGKRVIDIGCGDGVYTFEIAEMGGPSQLHGTDLVGEAVHLASSKAGSRPISFTIASATQLPFGDGSYDIAHVRGVLHHMERADLAIQEALRVARQVVVLEPNGNNLGLKVIERVSRYHREHHEKSYSSLRLRKWVAEGGGVVTRSSWIGLVPMFSPDWVARFAKALEPLVESLRPLAAVVCAVYLFVAERPPGPQGPRR